MTKERQVYRKSEFAELAGVSRPAVTQAVIAGSVVAYGGLIDITHPKNAAYLSSNRNKRTRLLKSDSTEESVDEKPVNNRRTTKKRSRQYPMGYDPSVDIENLSKDAVSIKQIIARTANLELKHAKELRTVLLRKDVERVFEGIYSVSVNYLLPIGGRLAPVLAGICGVTDQKKVIEIENQINNEVTRALNELKRHTEQGLCYN